MKLLCSILAVLMILPAGPALAQDLDLTVPDRLQGDQVAQAEPLEFTDHLVKWPALNARLAEERDKTNDTIAIVAWILLALVAVNHADPGGGGGDDPPPDPPCSKR